MSRRRMKLRHVVFGSCIAVSSASRPPGILTGLQADVVASPKAKASALELAAEANNTALAAAKQRLHTVYDSAEAAKEHYALVRRRLFQTTTVVTVLPWTLLLLGCILPAMRDALSGRGPPASLCISGVGKR
eukprot:TRINITY_DN4577_c0_g1_i5.p1 TRINITY_DN4577_c0_g1~~TRINITY_DN4577_c0_g1_i5.p1  ORF type:complete len:132 (-),score=23.14 TRINITY_DN4577_c0_g1_i5:378-773(-)